MKVFPCPSEVKSQAKVNCCHVYMRFYYFQSKVKIEAMTPRPTFTPLLYFCKNEYFEIQAEVSIP